MIKTKELLNKLTDLQLEILEDGLEGKTIEECNLMEVILNVHDQEYDARMGWGGISDEAQENFNEVYRVLNSLGEDEEIRRKKLIDYAEKQYIDLQVIIDRYIEEGNLEPKDIIEYGISTEWTLLNDFGVTFGFSDEEVSDILGSKELDFHDLDFEDIEGNIFDKVVEDNKNIERLSRIVPAYNLLNKLYNVVPEEFRDLISYDQISETIYFNGQDLGTIFAVEGIEIFNDEILVNDKSKQSFHKMICVKTADYLRNITFYYGLNEEIDKYECIEFEVGRKVMRNVAI